MPPIAPMRPGVGAGAGVTAPGPADCCCYCYCWLLGCWAAPRDAKLVDSVDDCRLAAPWPTCAEGGAGRAGRGPPSSVIAGCPHRYHCTSTSASLRIFFVHFLPATAGPDVPAPPGGRRFCMGCRLRGVGEHGAEPRSSHSSHWRRSGSEVCRPGSARPHRSGRRKDARRLGCCDSHAGSMLLCCSILVPGDASRPAPPRPAAVPRAPDLTARGGRGRRATWSTAAESALAGRGGAGQ